MTVMSSQGELQPISAADAFRMAYCEPGRRPALLFDLRQDVLYKRKTLQCAFAPALHPGGGDGMRMRDKLEGPDWGQDLWWGRTVILIGGDAKSSKSVVENLTSHPVTQALLREGKCGAIRVMDIPYAKFVDKYPFLVTGNPSKSRKNRKFYPSEIVEGKVYLGDWASATEPPVVENLAITHIVTIHNNPERAATPKGVKPGNHLRIEVADTETEPIRQYFEKVNSLIRKVVSKKAAKVLIHCGAGVSRSATLVASFLIEDQQLSAVEAIDKLKSYRSVVNPNAGFVKQLRDYSESLGIVQPPPKDEVERLEAKEAEKHAESAAAAAVAAATTTDSNQTDDKKLPVRPSENAKPKEESGEEEALVPLPSWADPPARKWRLEVTKDKALLNTIYVSGGKNGGAFVFGRHPQSEVVLEHPSASRLHAALVTDRRTGKLCVIDLSSANGTLKNSQKVASGSASLLDIGDRLSFGVSRRLYKVKEASRWEVDDADGTPAPKRIRR